HGPLVVARTLRGIPRARVAAPVVEEVQLRVVGIPAPGGAASALPLITLPGLDRGVGADGLHPAVGPRHRAPGIEEDLIVEPGAVGLPRQLAGLGIIGLQPSMHTELAAGDTGDQIGTPGLRRLER